MRKALASLVLIAALLSGCGSSPSSGVTQQSERTVCRSWTNYLSAKSHTPQQTSALLHETSTAQNATLRRIGAQIASASAHSPITEDINQIERICQSGGNSVLTSPPPVISSQAARIAANTQGRYPAAKVCADWQRLISADGLSPTTFPPLWTETKYADNVMLREYADEQPDAQFGESTSMLTPLVTGISEVCEGLK